MLRLVAFLLAILPSAASDDPRADGGLSRPFLFRDVIGEAGLQPLLRGIQAHAAAWGDVDGDGRPDLFIGAFYRDLRGHEIYRAPGPPVPGRMYINRKEGFVRDPASGVRVEADCTGAVLADFDNDGDLDLYVSNYRPKTAGSNQLFENDGRGRFKEIPRGGGAGPEEFSSRGVGVLDYDGDGLLDLFVAEGDRPVKHSRLFRNRGGLRFENVTRKSGLPTDISGLGVAAGDVTGDGWPDLFVAGPGSNRLFANRRGRFREVTSLAGVFRWESANPTYRDDNPCGAAFGDVNRDGKLDLIVGHHYKTPWRYPERIRLFLNCGLRGEDPVFQDISEAAGLEPLPAKAPHVEIRDFDNDGWPDIYTSIVVLTKGGLSPLIYRNLGVREGLPRFREDALAGVAFPTDAHRAMDAHQIQRTSPVRYFGAGPSGDFDGDGRLDLILPSWWPSLPSHLARNVTPGDRNWLRVKVAGTGRLNRMGIGARVSVYPCGRAGDPGALVGFREIATGYGYSSSQETIAHFGLGMLERCDVRVELPRFERVISREDVAAGQTLVIRADVP